MNTSSIPIGRIAAQTRRPGKVIGTHFMNPVPVMKLGMNHPMGGGRDLTEQGLCGCKKNTMAENVDSVIFLGANGRVGLFLLIGRRFPEANSGCRESFNCTEVLPGLK